MQQQKNYDKTSPLGIRILANKPYYVTLFRGEGILSGYVTRTKKYWFWGKTFGRLAGWFGQRLPSGANKIMNLYPLWGVLVASFLLKEKKIRGRQWIYPHGNIWLLPLIFLWIYGQVSFHRANGSSIYSQRIVRNFSIHYCTNLTAGFNVLATKQFPMQCSMVRYHPFPY